MDAVLKGLATAGLVAADDAVEVSSATEDYRRRRDCGRVAREIFDHLEDAGV